MKFSKILALILTFFVLTACFQKPADEVVNEIPKDMNEEENINTEEEAIVEDEDTSVTQPSDEENTDNEIEIWDTNSEVWDTNTGTSVNEQEIIEEYEEDLEALFSDLLGDDK